MRNAILISLTILISFKAAIAQNQFSENEKLAVTAKVWGFLKYYHPIVATGKFDWDKELFKILRNVKNASTKEELSQVFIVWMDNLGKVKECKNCKENDGIEYFNKNFDLSWIDDNQLFTDEVSERLKFIEQNRHQGKKFYVVSGKGSKNVKITNEVNYEGFDWNNENLRLLSLFRYWNIVEYFFPYKYQTDTNWDEVLNNIIPKFLYPETELDFHLAMLELIVSVDDSHAGFYTDKTSAFFGNFWIPAHFKLIDEKAVITGFYNESLAKIDDLRIGDIITKVNDQDIEAIFKEKRKYVNGSNISRKKLNAYNSIFNGPSDSVKIEFIRNNETSFKTVKRYELNELKLNELKIESKEVEKFKILNSNIGYVHMGLLKQKDVSNTMKVLIDTKAIIFDLRHYPHSTVYAIANYLISKNNSFYKSIYPDLDYPGKFIWKNGDRVGKNGELRYKGKVVLLVNEKTQSQGEFTAMCFQTGDNVTTIGSQTSGADGNYSVIEMVGGYKTAISGIGIFYPDDSETQRKGVKIDIMVKPTIQGIIDGRDEVLEKAIEFVNNNI